MGKETAPNRRYTDEYKQEALRLAESVGINQAAQRLGMPASSLGNWMRRKRSGKLPAVSGATPMKVRRRNWKRRTIGCGGSWPIPSLTWKS